MKRLIEVFKSPKVFILSAFLIWESYLFLIEILSPFILRRTYLGATPWFNFDGVHYLEIVKFGYFNYVQAFFPLFPILIKGWATILSNNYLIATFIIVYFFAIVTVFTFWKLIKIDYPARIASWSLIFLFFFPSSFFLVSAYTESLFLALIFLSFYSARKEKFLLAAVFGALASATRIVGVLILPSILMELYKSRKSKIRDYVIALSLIPSGAVFYMTYLWIKFGDPLLFVHVQPGFGAGRSGGDIILLPQVIYRYIKIFITVPWSNYDYWIALLEISMFIFASLLIYIAYKKGIRRSYILFSILALILPTLTGTFSSIPRYALVAFVIFPTLALIQNRFLRYTILIVGLLIETIISAFFLRGYFVS